ncbi:VIR protein [Plasmodium vivax]|uniref:VIR protein n=1 Tax=Plasmodium vivax TaxID=5855 RepID=A0A1G4ED89_PLAVI|nr:VIR protein [Plasmodium vivax]
MKNLSCTDVPVDEKYSFYEHIDQYLPYTNICISNNECDQYNDICILDELSFYDNSHKLSFICKRFHYLIDNFITTSKNPTDSKENDHLQYLNYWLNRELNLIQTHLDSKTLFQHIRIKNMNNGKLSKLIGKIKIIPKEEINNMYSLFYLYDYYINIIKATTEDDANEGLFHRYTKQCVEKYQPLEETCLIERTPFCKALCDFKKKYEDIYLSDNVTKDWTDRTLPSLSKNANTQVNDFKLPRDLDPPSPADADIPERVNRAQVTSSESPERDSEAHVKPGAMLETTTDSESIVEAGSFRQTVNSYLTDKSQRDLSETTEQTEIKSEDGFDKHTNKIIGTSISTVGVSSLFFLFYKFTSLGSRFRSQNKGKKYIKDNFDQQSNNFLDTSEYQYTPEENMSYNISYNSV